MFQNIVVSGQALEMNCISDLCLSFTLHDIDLLNDLAMKFSNVFTTSSAGSNNKRKKSLPVPERYGSHFRPMVDQFDNHLSDSGFKSNFYPDKRKSSEKSNSPKIEIPQMISFVGGGFTVQLYKSAVCYHNSM